MTDKMKDIDWVEWTAVSVPAQEVTGTGGGLWNWRPCLEWCRQQFGPSQSYTRDGDWYYSMGGEFEFKYAKDAMLFLLRWS